MIQLPDVLLNNATGTIEKALKRELEGLPPGTLPLDRGTTRGGFVDDSDISVTVIDIQQSELNIRSRVGVFFTEIIVGCSCGDDPFPENAYCELRVSIDRTTAKAEFEIIR